MNKQSLEELYALYGLPLAEQDDAAQLAAQLTPDVRAEFEQLSQLDNLLHETLTPAPMRVAFREDLRQSLMTTAMQRQGWRSMILVQLRTHWKLTAATASGVSVAVGAIGVVAWYRGRSQL
ncbi:MAG: hypothetical protein ABTQ73_09335 [Caldilineales bacterium]